LLLVIYEVLQYLGILETLDLGFQS
jgi:hypothetical protein